MAASQEIPALKKIGENFPWQELSLPSLEEEGEQGQKPGHNGEDLFLFLFLEDLKIQNKGLDCLICSQLYTVLPHLILNHQMIPRDTAGNRASAFHGQYYCLLTGESRKNLANRIS